MTPPLSGADMALVCAALREYNNGSGLEAKLILEDLDDNQLYAAVTLLDHGLTKARAIARARAVKNGAEVYA